MHFVALLRMRNKTATNIRQISDISMTVKYQSIRYNRLCHRTLHVMGLLLGCRRSVVGRRSEFAREMKADVGKILLRHGEDISAVGEKYVSALSVHRHELVLASLE